MPPRRKPAAPPPKLKVTVEYLEEDWDVEIIVPSWAMHKLKGGEPNDRFEEEGGESMWELYVQDHGERAARGSGVTRGRASACAVGCSRRSPG